MKTIIEELSPVKKKMMIEIESEEVDKKVNEAYRQVGKKAKIKGFRPGKVPRKILENYFSDQVLEDVTNTIVKTTLPEALEETKTYPLNVPVIENKILKPGQDYKYAAIMEVRPEFELKDYKGLEVEKEILSVTEEDVDRQLEEIRESRGTMKSIDEDRGARENDYVIIDYEGFDGEQAIEGIKAENYSLKIGNQEFYPGFKKALVGLKKGDTTEITIDFEDSYFHSRLAGKSVNFKVKVIDIKEMELPDLNDDFAKGLGDDFDGLGDLKKKIREGIIKREENRIDKELKERLLDKISDSVGFELPESLVEPEINSAIENIKQNLLKAGSTLENAGLEEEKLRKDFRPVSEKRVKGMLILGEIAGQNDLTVDEKDLSEGFKEMSESIGQDPEILRKYHEANNLMDSFSQTLLKEKTLNYLVENAKVLEVDEGKIQKK